MPALDYDYIAKLVRRTKKGDSNAFAELYTATYQKQYHFTCRYVKDPYLAQDVLQDVYIIVLKNIHALKNPRLFVSWLNQINFRVCFDVCNKIKKQPESPSSGDDLMLFLSDASGPEDIAIEHSEQREIQADILNLPPKEAQAIIMKYYNDMTIDEIADAMDLSKSTVKRQLASGKKRLKQMLAPCKGGVSVG